VFGRGDLKFAILRLLSETPMHGYEVMRALEDEAGGCYSASPGSVYPVLQMLEDQGYLEAEEKDGKKVYRTSEAGKAYLEENRGRVDDIFERISGIGERFAGAPMRDVTKSFVRLAQASFERAFEAAGNAEAKALRELKEILDRALHDIEHDGGA